LIFVKNREGVYLLANETTAEAYDLTPEEVEGKREADIIPSIEDSEEFREDDLEVIESGEPRKIPEERLTTADGETRILQTTKIPYQTSDSGEDAVLGYARDVTELKEYEQRLEAQRDNLDILNQVVRHDIRNNLQLVLAYAEILDGRVEEGHEEHRQKILEAARNAVDITTTARDVTEVLLRSEADHAPMGVQHVLEEQINDVRASHERAIVSVDEVIPDVEVLADNMLGSIFRNLLNNAIVHNDKALPEVAVSATADDEIVRVRIADNGPGIPDEQKEEVFQRGEKGLDSGGTGLGLYLVQTLTDRYGGDVWLEDNEPEGSLFIVELPRCE
jgi:PAS domain S-box-containing protein